MIIDTTGVELTPGNRGEKCNGNGLFVDRNGEPIECCCEECDYMLCCLENHDMSECESCMDEKCPNVLGKQ